MSLLNLMTEYSFSDNFATSLSSSLMPHILRGQIACNNSCINVISVFSSPSCKSGLINMRRLCISHNPQYLSQFFDLSFLFTCQILFAIFIFFGICRLMLCKYFL